MDAFYAFFTEQYKSVILLVLFFLLFFFGWKKIHQVENHQREGIKYRKGRKPIETDTPEDHPIRQGKLKALKSVGKRFSIIRWGIISCIAIILLPIAIFPLINKVSAAAISLLAAVFAVIIGVAARSTLENLLAGIMLTFSGVIRESDTVIIGKHYGTIEDITWTHTVIKLWNWQRKLVPNSQFLAQDFLNLTIYDAYQWCHVEFWVAHDADLQKVKRIAIEAISASEHLLDVEPANFWVMEMGKEGIRCWVAAWADSPGSAWELSHDTRMVLANQLHCTHIKPSQFHLVTNQ